MEEQRQLQYRTLFEYPHLLCHANARSRSEQSPASTLKRASTRRREKKLYKEIRQAYSNAVAADKAIAAAENSKAATLKAYEYARDSFEAGRLSAYEYAEAKTKYALSQVEELRAKYDFIYKAKVLDFYQGKDF
nr:TolC family protein [Porphyromonas gingivalis]